MKRSGDTSKADPSKADTSTADLYIPFSAPTFGFEERQELLAALDSDWITTGPRAREFEQKFAAYVGASHAVALNSCTAALHLALEAVDVGPGDAVVTTPFTFAATANVIVHLGASPIFVDIDPNTYNLDPAKLQHFVEQRCIWNAKAQTLCLRSDGRRVRAIIPVHYGGNPCEMDAIGAIAAAFRLALIEDAAHAAGAKYRGRAVGTLGTAACFSFYANKNMTTAEGGMLTTNDSTLASRARMMSLHGITRDSWERYGEQGAWRYDLVDAGFKYNMPDLAAALGLHQLCKLDAFIESRTKLAARYSKALRGLAGVQLPVISAEARMAWHLYPIQITSADVTRDAVVQHLREQNIGSSVHFIPLHLMSFYQRAFGFRRGDLPVAEQVFDRILSIPLFPRMGDGDVDRVVASLWSILDKGHLAAAG